MLEDLGLPPEATTIMSIIVGGMVTYSAGKFFFEDASGEVIEYTEEDLRRVFQQGTQNAWNESKVIQNIDDLSSEQLEALVKYTGPDYANINNSLRGMETLTIENQSTVETIKSALDSAALPQDMTLYRGTSTEALGSFKSLSADELVGKTITEQGFMSTSTSSTIADSFTGNMYMTIEASEGVKALDISSISQYTIEAEVLFNAGQEMLITSAEVKDGILYITVIIE